MLLSKEIRMGFHDSDTLLHGWVPTDDGPSCVGSPESETFGRDVADSDFGRPDDLVAITARVIAAHPQDYRWHGTTNLRERTSV